MTGIRAILKHWKAPFFATAVAVVAYIYAPPDMISTVSGELINFFGFVIAAVLPAMALTATSLRGSGMSIRRLVQLRDALHRQMSFWAGLVIASFFAVAFVVVLKPYLACSGSKACNPIIYYEYSGYKISSRLFNALLAYIFGIVFYQLSNVLRGLTALLTINAEAAIGEAQQRFDDQMSHTGSEISQIKNPPGFGEIVELPNDRT